MTTDGIQITVNQDRPGFVDMTFTLGKRKVYLFETSNLRFPYNYVTNGNPERAPTGQYAVYSLGATTWRYFEGLLSAQIYAAELINELHWGPQQGPRDETFKTVPQTAWRNW